MKGIIVKFRVIIILVCIICIVAVGGIIIFRCFFGEFAGIKKETLQSYSCTTGGDMNGGHDTVTVSRYDETHGIITFSSAEWHYQDSVISEYLVNNAIFDEIKAVFCKYNMQRWHQKNFSNMFIADGASTGYSFRFDNKSVNFSSQHYPTAYSHKLAEFDDIIEKYKETGECLPGLILQENSQEEYEEKECPSDGKIHFDVYEYSENTLHFRFSNGTENDISIDCDIALYKDGVDIPLNENQTEHYTADLCAGESDEDSVELKELLSTGKYTLKAGEFETVFEIG